VCDWKKVRNVQKQARFYVTFYKLLFKPVENTEVRHGYVERRRRGKKQWQE
jgi:hypothetical protein